MSTVTLIGSRLAEVGQTFVYEGEAPGCADCPFREQCLNLEVGSHYRVSSVREGGQELECAVHDQGVRAVEVEPASFVAAVPSANAYVGSRVQLAGPCPHTGCPSHGYCDPEGGAFNTTYRINEVVGEPPHEYCSLDRELTLVELSEE
ncbi:MAG: UPF0179 family protein [Salinarchaeum sp.]